MKTVAKNSNYFTGHLGLLVDVARIGTGIIIFIEGLHFINNSSMLSQIFNNSRVGGFAIILEHHVAFTLLVGGVFIAIGFITRISILFELLVFVGVLFNQHVHYGLYTVYGNFTFALFITLVLIALLITGPGKFSVDYLIKENKLL